MIEFLNESNVPQPDGTRKTYPAGATAPKSEVPELWLANALQRGAVKLIDEPKQSATVTTGKPSQSKR